MDIIWRMARIPHTYTYYIYRRHRQGVGGDPEKMRPTARRRCSTKTVIAAWRVYYTTQYDATRWHIIIDDKYTIEEKIMI